ncbi:hypothetical protein G5V58_24535 [Nocardioides anomalus]|uniref:Uncharacterized protein n=1 Tax=Nocardioides anomalus TaxID=2712223 RepID=A0A6G6WJI0_9ACTN|nr:hypothetical protein [Nocardioides anomalus]QIG45491.1 hypothetical protein G5V58_24535 [Nocardioides anomalus]
MSTTPIEVADWTKEAQAFEPDMTATVAADAATALDALAAGLESQGYKIKDRTGSGFRATQRDLVRGALGIITISDFDILEHTTIAVGAAPADGGTLLTISVQAGGQRRSGRKRGQSGLTAGLQELQRRGIGVVITPWRKA